MKVFEQQLERQRKWRLRPRFQQSKIFDELLANEFFSSNKFQSLLTSRALDFLSFAVTATPYYQQRAQQYNIARKGFSLKSLESLPILDRSSVQQYKDDLIATILPPGVSVGGYLKTSGSTGQPVKVLHSSASLQLFSLLKQREYRCWGIDPTKSLMSIRPAVDLPKNNGELLANNQLMQADNWLNIGAYFETGKSYFLPDTTEIESIAERLNQVKPGYLLCMAAVLEHIGICFSHTENRSGLLGALSISQQLTAGMRSLAEKYVTADVYQNYGLNEIGLVAMRCPESGYYHVHNECALIEIVDNNGLQCEPGQSGKLLVTSIGNHAMPLIRYDTDDLAELPLEPCPCGRTMQAFTNIRGRYRRTAHLPAGTWDYWAKLLDIFADATEQEMRTMQQYQLHQVDEMTYRLNVKTQGQFASALKQKIYATWASGVGNDKPASITIVELTEIVSVGKKFQNFVSDIVPDENN
jgi:phenylacetate-CoA ligase|tara:strand:+ start:6479 stop:7885 length:1407 start_codon:yes stop_codon:yes gene_type:complete